MAKSSKIPALERLASQVGPIQQVNPIQIEGITERLVQSMKSWVLDGLVAAGERLPPERDLAASLKVSRSSLRQALKALEVMGVVEARQGSGTYLTDSAEAILRQPTDLLMPLRGVSFGELFEARRAMEAEAAATAALRGTAEDFDALAAVIDRMRRYLTNPTVYFASDVAFHQKITQISGNSVFLWFNQMAGKVMADAWRKRAQYGDTTRTFAEHEAIFHAIQRRAPDAARARMLEHLVLAKFYSQEPTHLELRVTAPHDAVA